MNQQHSYWTKHSYVAIENADAFNVKRADSLLPDQYCIVPVDMLKNLDAPADLADRLKLAESLYHKLKEKYNNLLEEFNIRDRLFEE